MKSVYSIGTSRVTKDLDDESDEKKGDDKANSGSDSKHVAIDRMDILHSDGKHGAMLFSAASMEERSAQAKKEGSAGEKTMEGFSVGGEESDSSKEKEWQDEEKEESYLTAKMNTATAQLNLDSNDEGSNFQENNMNVQSDDLDLQLQGYASNAQEVLSGEFDAAYVKKYANPKIFLHALWNAAGPSAGAMVTCFDIIKVELEG